MKKIWITALTFIGLLFGSTLETQAAQTVTWTYTNLTGSTYALISDCIDIGNEIGLAGTFAKSDYAEYSFGGIDSAISFYSDAGCLGGDFLDSITLYELSPSDRVDIPVYELEMPILFPGENVGSIRVTLLTNLTTASAPGGYVNYMSTNSEFTFGTPNTVIFIDGLTTYYTTQYITRVPFPTDPTRSGFDFNYWQDINGNPFTNVTPDTSQLIDGDLYLYSNFSESYTITPPVQLPPDVDLPIDIILYNTGFFNTAGFLLLYLILIVALNVGLWYIGIGSNYASLIGNIAITATFMFLGYLPIYVAALMIMFYIYMVFGMNRSVTYE